MSSIKGLVARARSVFGARASEARMEEEFAFHVAMEAERLAARDGIPLVEARRRALASFGGRDAHREEMRDGRGARWLDDFAADVRYALRAMRRAPGFAAAVAVTLGLGIGVNGIVFGYVDALLFRPVPARDAGRLVALFNVDTKSRQSFQVGYEDYVDFRDRSDAFLGLAGMTGVPLNLVVPDAGRTASADMIWGEMVTENFFTVLGMRPAAGRFFTTDDAPQGANPFAVISDFAWASRFNRDPSVVGKQVRVNGTPFTIIGVAPPGFKGMRTFGFWPEMWVPIGMHDVVRPGSARQFQGRGGGNLMVVGRMLPGSDRATTEIAAARFARQLELAYPASNANVGAIVIPAEIGFDDPNFVKTGVLRLASMLGVFASLVTLIIICANLANLQLTRAAARAHEIAIRLSLGCSRARLTRQMLVESIVLAVPGALLASLFIQLSPVFERAMAPHLQFRVGFGTAVNVRIVMFTVAVAALAIVLFGLAPALRSSGALSLSSLIGNRRSSAPRPRRLRSGLVVGQLALSVVLLVGATLFVRSLMLARAADLGFDRTNRALLSVNVGLQNYKEAQARRFYDDVLARVRALPGVVSAAWAFPVPFDTYGRSVSLYVPGASAGPNPGVVGVNATVVAEDFVKALGLRLAAGRDFTIGDSLASPGVIVVSRRLAERLWPGKDPIGQRARRGSDKGSEVTVVGVVDDAKFETIGPSSLARAYLPLRQNYRDWQTLVVHTRDDASGSLARLRHEITALDPVLPVFGATTMDVSVANGLSTSTSAAGMAGFFGVLALLISAVGLYAVVASGVTERTRELGIRTALGATPREVMRLVMRGGARLGLIGLLIGLAGAIGVSQLMRSLLYGLSPADPVTFALVPLVLAGIVLAATYLPARRAVRLDPMIALREN